MRKVSFSEASTFRQCRLKWYLGYLLGYNSTKPAAALILGTAVHAGLEGFYRPVSLSAPDEERNPDFAHRTAQGMAFFDEAMGRAQRDIPEDVWSQDVKEMFEELSSLGRSMLHHYFGHARIHDNFDVLATEQYFRIPILNEKGNRTRAKFTGLIDMIVQDYDGRIWVWENKTCSQFYSEFEMDMSDQVTRYAWAAQQLYPDLPFAGIYYNNLRKLTVGAPGQLKNGRLSKSQDFVGTADEYREFIIENEEDPEDEHYADFLGLLETRNDPAIQRHKTYRTASEIEHMREQIFAEYQDMLDAKRLGRFYRSTSKDCSWSCSFVEVCRALYDDGDVDYLLEADFKRREG